MSETGPFLSVVVPVFNEARQLSFTVDAIASVMVREGWSYELILVDDGSGDGTWQEIVRISAVNTAVMGVKLSRNFGKEAALCAGLDRVKGQAVITMDADLQHPPDVIPEMVRVWQSGFPIVDALKRKHCRQGFVQRLGARGFYGVLRRLSNLDLRKTSDFKLLDARIIAAWRMLSERETFYRGLIAWVGFKHGEVHFDVAKRTQGASKWPRLRLVQYAISAILSFSAMPMQVVTTLGFVFLAVAIPLTLQTLYNKFTGHASDGFTTVITLQLIIGSVLMISLGIIGSYIARIFEEVKNRPRYLISDLTGGNEKPDAR
ncbi:MAG: glycosyltransferase family 2 protein [Opitutaceae bacterium]|nr:glycosyltransferase family 2 protein [Opitutaceae bacterium]